VFFGDIPLTTVVIGSNLPSYRGLFPLIFTGFLREDSMADTKGAKGDRPLTKSAILQELSTATALSKKQVSDVFDALGSLVKRELGKKGNGIVTVPGIALKIKRVTRPATKARPGRNPATGETMIIKAKPARVVVKALALKSLKEWVK
jgi:nucleoid DNA-binding protein